MGPADLHTIVNHFTIALINIGIIFELTAAIFKNERMQRFSWNCLRLGLAFALVSVLTGFITSSNVLITAQVEPIHNYHKILSYVAVGILAVAVLMRTVRRDQFEDSQSGAALRGAYLALITVVFFLTGITGFLGTRMVYTYGVNVEPYERILESMPPPVTHPQLPLGTNDTLLH